MKRMFYFVLAAALAVTPPTASANDQSACTGWCQGSTLKVSTKGSPKPWYGANVVCTNGQIKIACTWCMSIDFVYSPTGKGYGPGGKFFTPNANLPYGKAFTLQCGRSGTISIAPTIGVPAAGSWIVFGHVSEGDCSTPLAAEDTQSAISIPYVVAS